jgi:hypothetical protein
MKRKGFLLALLLIAAIPAVALARGPTATEQSNAATICAGLEKAMGGATFKATYGTNGTRSDALGKCVARWAKIEQQDTLKATHQCALEQNDANFAASHGGKTFAQFYGTGKSGMNAFGRCVSLKVRATTAQQAGATLNAAQACARERAADAAAFKAKYGTNANKSNAFGKCVSKNAQTAEHATANAAKACKAERDSLGEDAFAAKYGTNGNATTGHGKNGNGKNAFGKCVSQHAQAAAEHEADETASAAKACKAERAHDPAAFKKKYGNFGHCVSAK